MDGAWIQNVLTALLYYVFVPGPAAYRLTRQKLSWPKIRQDPRESKENDKRDYEAANKKSLLLRQMRIFRGSTITDINFKRYIRFA
jgi:hypothetical protein